MKSCDWCILWLCSSFLQRCSSTISPFAPEITREDARNLYKVDLAFWAASVVALIAGLILWLGVGKPASFYSPNSLFHTKLGLFFGMLICSIPATKFFRLEGRRDESDDDADVKIETPTLSRSLVRGKVSYSRRYLHLRLSRCTGRRSVMRRLRAYVLAICLGHVASVDAQSPAPEQAQNVANTGTYKSSDLPSNNIPDACSPASSSQHELDTDAPLSCSHLTEQRGNGLPAR